MKLHNRHTHFKTQVVGCQEKTSEMIWQKAQKPKYQRSLQSDKNFKKI
jgi:hypothetical protein